MRVVQRLAVFERDDLGEVRGVFEDKVVPAAEEGGARAGWSLAEGGEGNMGGFDCRLGVGCIELGASGDLGAGGGVCGARLKGISEKISAEDFVCKRC